MPQVMLIEANLIIRDILNEYLQKVIPQLTITDAINGEDGLLKIQEAPPHLIFMDLQLPDLSGLVLTKIIKKDFPNIHIAILISYDMPEYRQAVLQSGADRCFVKKSFTWEEVEAFVQSVLLRKMDPA